MTKYRYTDAALAASVEESFSIAGVMRVLGIAPAGGSHFHISKRIKKLHLDTSHFTGQAHSKGKTFTARRRTAGQILISRHEIGTRERPHLLRRALRDLGVTTTCARCGIGEEWNGEPLVLHVDHINGDPLDCRPGNLQFLCPNCHSQTPHFCRKASARATGVSAA